MTTTTCHGKTTSTTTITTTPRRKMVMAYFVLLMTWTLQLPSGGQALDPWSTSSWRLMTTLQGAVGDYEMMVKARSSIDCVRQCERYSFCYFLVFHASSGNCYLNARLHSNPPNPLDGKAYANVKGPSCVADDAPQIDNGQGTLTASLTSFRFDVTCNMDLMNTTGETYAMCLRDGTWLTEGACVRHVWRNPSTSLSFKMPIPIVAGWAMCLDGTPTDDARFTLDLIINSTGHALHVDFRFSYSVNENEILMKTKQGKDYPNGEVINEMPFTKDVPFKIKIKLTNGWYFKLYVDGVYKGRYKQQPSVLASDVKTVKVYNGIKISKLDLWC